VKYLGIDYGTKRIGIAVSDESGSFAFPKKIIASGAAAYGRRALAEILEIISNEKIQKIIIGNSLDQNGARNSLMDDVDVFSEELEKRSGIPVELQDERFSSMFAKSFDFEKSDFNVSNFKNKTKNAPDHIDDRAAAMMLQRYLDKNK